MLADRPRVTAAARRRAPRSTPIAPAPSSVATTPRRSASSATAAAASTANCQRLGQRARERDRGAEDRADRGRAGAVEERARAHVARAGARSGRRRASMNENDGVNATTAASSAPAEAVRGVADRGDRRDDRAGRDLAERDRVQELGVGHPVIGVDGVALHQRDDHEAAAERERADLERGPRQRADPAGSRPTPGSNSSDRRRRGRARRAGSAARAARRPSSTSTR